MALSATKPERIFRCASPLQLTQSLIAAGLIALSLVALDASPGVDWDEGWTMSVAQNWVEHGFYGRLLDGQFAPNGLEASFPVVSTVALSMRLFGVGIWQGRLPAVLTMLAALAVLYWVARHLFDGRIALATLLILVFLVPHPRANVFWMARQMFAEPLQCLTLAGGFGALVLARSRSRRWLLVAMLALGTALVSKAQVLPFFLAAGSCAIVLNELNGRHTQAFSLTAVLLGSLVTWQLWGRLQSALLAGHSMTAGPVGDVYLVLGLVPSPTIRFTALVVVALVGTPVVLGLLFFLAWRVRHKCSLRLTDRDDDLRVALWVLASTWLLWFALLAHAGIVRYIFSPLFFGAPFAALAFSEITGGFDLRPALARLALPLRTHSLHRVQAGMWVAFLVVLFYLPLTLYMSYATATAAEGCDLAATATYLNEQTPLGARIETYESPLFSLLHRPFHYPPDALHLELNKRAARLPATVVYDPLESDPDYLVVGATGGTWNLYTPVLLQGFFTPVQTFGQYEIFQRVRPSKK